VAARHRSLQQGPASELPGVAAWLCLIKGLLRARFLKESVQITGLTGPRVELWRDFVRQKGEIQNVTLLCYSTAILRSNRIRAWM